MKPDPLRLIQQMTPEQRAAVAEVFGEEFWYEHFAHVGPPGPEDPDAKAEVAEGAAEAVRAHLRAIMLGRDEPVFGEVQRLGGLG